MTPERRFHNPRRDYDDAGSSSSQAAAATTTTTSSPSSSSSSVARNVALIRRRSTTTSIERDQQQQQQQQEKGTSSSSSRPPGVALRRQDPIYLWSSLAAGVGSGALASLLCAPLDLVRTRLQVWGQVYTTTTTTTTNSTLSNTIKPTTTTTKTTTTPTVRAIPTIVRDIVRQDGARGLFRGLGATLLTVPAFWGVYFPLYDDCKRYLWLHYATPDTHPAWIHMTSAVLAGAVSDVICNPMFVIRTRLQTEALHSILSSSSSSSSSSNTAKQPSPASSILQTARALYHEAGGSPLIFWRGMSANLLGLSHVAVQFPVYEHLKVWFKGHDKEHESPLDLLLASSCSKMTASLLTYPHEVVRSRLMDVRSTHGLTLWHVCRSIYRSEGWWGFYAGLPVTLLRVLPNTCVTFLSYELILRYVWQHITTSRQ